MERSTILQKTIDNKEYISYQKPKRDAYKKDFYHPTKSQDDRISRAEY